MGFEASLWDELGFYLVLPWLSQSERVSRGLPSFYLVFLVFTRFFHSFASSLWPVFSLPGFSLLQLRFEKFDLNPPSCHRMLDSSNAGPS